MISIGCTTHRDGNGHMYRCCLGRVRDVLYFLGRLSIRSAQELDESIYTTSGPRQPKGMVHVAFPMPDGGF